MNAEEDVDIIVVDSDEENDKSENETSIVEIEKDDKETPLHTEIENKNSKTPALAKLETIDSQEDSDDSSEEENEVKKSPRLSKGAGNVYYYLDKAVEEIRKGGSLTETSLRYSIPESVLYEKLLSRNLPDVSTLLTRADEDNLVKWILRSIKSNSLVFKNELMEKVGKMKKISRITPIFHKSKYGRLWYFYFLSSHPEIYENEGLLLKCEPVSAKTIRRRPIERHHEENGNQETIKTEEAKTVRRRPIERCNGENSNQETIKTEDNNSVTSQPIERCNGENNNDEKIKTEEVTEEQLLSAYNIKKAVVILHDCRNQSNGLNHFNVKESETNETKKGSMSENYETVTSAIEHETGTINWVSKNSSCSSKDVSNPLYSKYKKRRFEVENNNNKVTCKVCNKTLFNKRSLTQHLVKVHNSGKPQTPVICSKCFKLFPSEVHYKTHVNNVHNYMYYKCDKCDTIFKHIKSARSHYKKKHPADDFSPQTLFVCDICGQRFKFKNSLECHIKNDHPKRETTHCCDICYRTFTELSHLKRHRLLHLRKKPTICPGCGKIFAQKLLLNKHMHNCSMSLQKDVDLECRRISKEYLDEIVLD